MKKKAPRVKTPDYEAACVNCGRLIAYGSARPSNDNKFYCADCAPGQNSALSADTQAKAPRGFVRALVYLACLLSPAAGLLAGAILYAQPMPEIRSLGKKLMILSSVLFILILIFTVLMMAAGALVTNALMPPGTSIGESYF